MGALVSARASIWSARYSSFDMRMGSHPEFRIRGHVPVQGLPPHILERANR